MIGPIKTTRVVLSRYIITNLLILLIPFVSTLLYYMVATRSMEDSVNSIVNLQLERDIESIDQKIKNIDKQIENIILDYDIIHYLNSKGEFSDIELYNSQRVSQRLSSLAAGGAFLTRCFLFLKNSDIVIMDNGYSSYDSFYGTIFAAEGYTSQTWKGFILSPHPKKFSISSGYSVTEGGRPYPAHMIIRQVGMNEFHRGTIVVVIDAEELARSLTRLPELYNGWLLVSEDSNAVIASSSEERSNQLLQILQKDNRNYEVTVNNETYRMYSKTSSYNNWTYTVFLNKDRITADLRLLRNRALIIIITGFFIGVIISCITAFSNTRPLERVFSLLGTSSQTGITNYGSLYSSFEESIMKLSTEKQRLESEVETVTAVSRAYFMQSLIYGDYNDKDQYKKEKERFGITFHPKSYFVITVHQSSIAIAVNTGERADIISILLKEVDSLLNGGEYAVKSTAGTIAIILSCDKITHYRNNAEKFIESFLNETASDFREYIHFGIGKPVLDPFLLPISYNEAEAAVLSLEKETTDFFRFYEDFPASAFTYRYPLHLEEAISRAVRGANLELLSSLVSVLRTENFKDRNLSHQEGQNLVHAFRGTALRLQNEFPDDFGKFAGSLNDALSIHNPPAAFEEIAALLYNMADEREKGKRGHKTRLAGEIEEYIVQNLHNPALDGDFISRKFNLTKTYIYSFFKEQQGISLSHYIRKLRLEKASRELRDETRIPLKDIATLCGYRNVQAFKKDFKLYYGLSPAEYRDSSS